MTLYNPNGFARITAAILVVLTALACAPDSAFARTVVTKQGLNAGTILVRTGERRLYFGVGGGKAILYRVGVGRADRQWTGRRFISGKALKPAWRPTAEIRRDRPNIAAVIPSGAPENPMGAAALLISGSGQYAIHGTNKPGSIGQNQDPGRVFPGKRMAGHLGDVRRTVQNLEIVRIDAVRKLLLLKGAVPGAKGGHLIVRAAVKAGA